MEPNSSNPPSTEATVEAAPKTGLAPDPSAPTLTLPRSISEQITEGPKAASGGPTPDVGLSPPKFRARYEVGQELGHGGMGVVYTASDRDLGRTVAMKVMQADVTGSREHAERFLREVQTTAQLEHPNIMPVYDVGLSDQGLLYYTMKLVRGKTLAAVLKELKEKRDEHSIPRLLGIFTQVCNGITYAHAKGVLHRDLKPENIMLGEHGEVVVMDWGLAKVLGSREAPPKEPAGPGVPSGPGTPAPPVRVREGETLSGTVIGTPAYMAPEQARADARAIGPHTDVYALGAILYEVLTLRPPFVGTTSKEILTKVLRGKPVPPRALNRQVTKPLDAICRTAMRPDTSARYASVQALAEDVGRYLEGKPVSAYREGFFEGLARSARRNRKHILRAAAVFAACLVFLGAMRFAGMRRAEGRARIDLEKALGAARGIDDTEATFDQRTSSYLDARRQCDNALRIAPNFAEAQRTRAEVILQFARAAFERRQFDLAQSLALELEMQVTEWEDLKTRVEVLSHRLDAEKKTADDALGEVFSKIRSGEIQLPLSSGGVEALPPAVESQVGTPRGRWSIDACLVRLSDASEAASVRALAALLLGRYGAREDSVLRALRAGLAAKTPDALAVACADALAALGDVGAAPDLVARLSDAVTHGAPAEEDLLQVEGQAQALFREVDLVGLRMSLPNRLIAALARLGPKVAPDVERVMLAASASTPQRTVGYQVLSRLGGETGMRAVLRAAHDTGVGGVLFVETLVRRLDPSAIAASRAACDVVVAGLLDPLKEVRYLCLLLVAGNRGGDSTSRFLQQMVAQTGVKMELRRAPSPVAMAWPEDVCAEATRVAKEMMGEAKEGTDLHTVVLNALAAVHTLDAERELLAHVGDEDAESAQVALGGLEDASPELLPDLLLRSSGASAAVRASLFRVGEAALQRSRWSWKPAPDAVSAEARKAILQGVSRGDEGERLLCVGAAGLFCIAEARADLEQIVRGPAKAALRRRAAWAIGRIGDPASQAVLLTALHDERDPAVRDGIALGLARYHSRGALPLLQESLGRREYSTSLYLRAAVQEVVGFDVSMVAEAMSRETSDASWMSLATVLSRIPGETAAQTLQKLGDAEGDRGPLRRLHVEALLFERGDERRLDPVLAALTSEREEVKAFARATLVRWFHIDCGADAPRWKGWWEQNRSRVKFDAEAETFVRTK